MACVSLSRCSRAVRSSARSEEHTSELQSPCNLVCRLLLEKKELSLRYNSAPLPRRGITASGCPTIRARGFGRRHVPPMDISRPHDTHVHGLSAVVTRAPRL